MLEAQEPKASHPTQCACSICQNNSSFEFPEDLISSFLEGKLTIFAGAGISTEGKDVIGHSLYDEIKKELGERDHADDFPTTISNFCKRPNGRLRFIEKLNKRIRDVKTSPEFHRLATTFHRALAYNCKLDTIVTTNWDDFFETECWAKPFVYPEDTAFWSAAERRVLKIHGTIENLGSIVASSEDYDAYQKRLATNMIGSRLKIILSETTVLFCGYSLRDYDFQAVMRFVKNEMRGFHRQAYIVTIDRSAQSLERFNEFGIIPIYTDATFFISNLYEEWKDRSCVAPASLYGDASEFLEIVREEHLLLSEKITMFDHPSVIFSLCYQDGLIRGLDRIKMHKKSGEYSDLHITQFKISRYRQLKKKSTRLRRYADTAYIEGYLSALIYAAMYKGDGGDDDLYPPLYFDFNDKYFSNIDEYEQHLRSCKEGHAASRKYAASVAAKYDRSDNIVLDHSFRLDGIL